MAYNLDIYENLIFDVPSARKMRYLHVVAALLFGLLTTFINHVVRMTSGQTELTAVVAIAVFLIPAMAAAEFVYRLAPRFVNQNRKNWCYLITLIGQGLVFIFAVAALLLGADGRVLGIGLVFVTLTTFSVLVLAAGTDRFTHIGFASTLQGVSVLGIIHVSTGIRPIGASGPLGTLPSVLNTLLIMLLINSGLVLSVLIHERLFDANVTYIDGANLTAALLQGRAESIDTGEPAEPRVHTLCIERDEKSAVFLAPWIHPGPITSFGGGRVTVDVIDHLNSQYDAGFYMKVPATHKSDPATTEAAEKVCVAASDPRTYATATRLHTREVDGISLRGRRFGDQRIVFVEPPNKDDFDIGVIADVIHPEETIIIDRHADRTEGYTIDLYEASEARRLRGELRKFLTELDELETLQYHAGWAVDHDRNHDEKAIVALVERVDGQETLVLGSNANEMSDSLSEFEQEIATTFDETVVFTTDTHHDLWELADRTSVDRGRLENVVEKAQTTCAEARIGFGVDSTAEMRLLGEEYYALMHSINIVLRSFTISLVLLYLLAVVAFFLI